MLNRLSIRYKIGLIALIGLLGFVVFQTTSYRLSINLRDQMQLMISEDFAMLQFPSEVQGNFSELDKLYQAALAESDMDILLEADAKATEMKLRFDSIQARYKINDPYFTKLVEYFNAYVEKASTHTAAVLTNTLDYDKTYSGYTEMSLLRERYHEMEGQFLKERYQLFEAQLQSIQKQEAFFVQFGLVLGVVLSVLLILFSLFIIRRLISAFSNAVNVAEQIASGNLEQKIETLAQDETGLLINSLTLMRDALKKQKEDDIHREQVQSFLAGLNDVMRGDKTLEELTQLVLNYLVTEMHAQLGIFYVLEDGVLSMIASHACPQADDARHSFKLGETIVGQAAVEQRVQIINDIPDNYVQVGSAIGKAMPRSILLFPVIFENMLKGVIEIGAFRRFNEEDVQLMHRCNDAIAVAFNSAQSRFKIVGMLKQTQEQAQELKKQRQELALFNRQLEEKTQYLDSQRNEILEKNQELERSGKELIQKSRALEVSGQYKSQFLSTMSHELRTPLNSILILSEALVENRNAHLDEREVQHAKVINNAGADLLTLINDILDLSKVEEGKMEIVIDEVEINELKTSFVQQFDYITKDKGLDFAVSVAPDVNGFFYTDKHRLKQIIKNFISNSLKFTEKGGVYLDILHPDAAFKAQYPQWSTDSNLLFRVRDTGVGIDKSKQALVFQAFQQADGTTSRKYGGTGLGLTISLSLAKMLGGDIILQSEGDGKGCSFTLVLPMADPALAEPATRSPVSRGNNASEKNTLSGNNSFVYPLSDDLLLLLAEKTLIDSIVSIAVKNHVNCHIEENCQSLQALIKKQHYSTALIQFNLLGENPAEEIKSQLDAIDDLYILADIMHKELIEKLGCHFVPAFKGNEEISVFVLQAMEMQRVHSGKVLVIEDNPVFQEVLRVVFANHQLNVTVASDGKQALEYMQNTAFDCLIVDLNLPDYKGTELLEKIRSNELYKTQPIIVFTAEDLSTERQTEIKRYASQILLKTPKVIVSLCESVKQFLHEQKHKKSAALLLSATENPHQLLQGKCLLLVDDDARNIYSMSAMLEAEGVSTLAAKSGLEALDILKKQGDIDMVLLDIMMPEMDGYEVLRRIRLDAVLHDMPVITITAKAMVGDKEKCLEAGATDYLSKPVEKQVLLSRIVTILSRVRS